MRDYESTDLAGAAHLAREADSGYDDRPSRSDLNETGCVCGPDCEHPCWQRLGQTDWPCCPGCPPLPDPGRFSDGEE